MTNHSLSNVKDKIIGSAKSTLGNVTNNENMKTKGDHQYVQAVEVGETRMHQEPHDDSSGRLHGNKEHHGNKGHCGDQALHPGNQGDLYGKQGAAKDDSRVHKAEAFGERVEGNVKHGAGQAIGSDKMMQSGERDRLHGQRKYEDNVAGVEGSKQPFAQQQVPEQQFAQQPQQHAQSMQNQHSAQGRAQDLQNKYPEQGTAQDPQNQYSQQLSQQQNPDQPKQQYPGQQSSF
ncbi:hypothetical protein GGH12_001712 [Coemansia sp. RSA 1822]|nr:hypothetical protein LPJ76_001244 [Coemansia sp. RSA 638]KAJ2545754.1 hypothetical protein GGF49_000263 [Coemansia sp. RSA 1853]KAJ2564899.1 hypothetical protein GGH12_001712 [Coemansia sp. RSA 1822]